MGQCGDHRCTLSLHWDIVSSRVYQDARSGPLFAVSCSREELIHGFSGPSDTCCTCRVKTKKCLNPKRVRSYDHLSHGEHCQKTDQMYHRGKDVVSTWTATRRSIFL